MLKSPPQEHCPVVRIDVEDGRANLYVDGILARHRVSEEAQDLAWRIMCGIVPDGTEITIGINGFAVYDVAVEHARALAPRLAMVWRADSGLGLDAGAAL